MNNALKAGLLKNDLKTKDAVLVAILESMICSICHDLMFVPVMTQCGHNYCYDCISSWFDSNSNELSCPQCRGSINNPPTLNSVLQQCLGNIIELIGKNKTITDGEFRDLMSGRESSEKSYKFDEKNDILFGNVFKTSAMGVIDEDDDGILRCSNCHWELEDDVGDVCPHCNSRIRSRMRSSISNDERLDNDDDDDDDDADNDEDDDDDDDDVYDGVDEIDVDEAASNDGEIRSNNSGLKNEISQSVHHYTIGVRELAHTLLTTRNDCDERLLTMGTTATGVPFYFPTYAMYLSNDYSLSERERSRRMKLAEKVDTEEETPLGNSRGSHSEAYQHYEDDELSEDTEISSDDTRPNAYSFVDTEAEHDDEDDEAVVDSSHDSDYYERHDGGFASGDSLDDTPAGEDSDGSQEDLDEEEDHEDHEDHEGYEDQDKESSDDSSYNRGKSRHGRKRFHVVVDSEDE